MISGQFTSRILQYLEDGTKEINEALLEEASKRTKVSFKRQLMEERSQTPGVLRMSSGGHCIRKQWYPFKGESSDSLSGRTINTFLTGDLLEVGLSILGRLAGWQLLGKPEGEDEIEIDEVKGHPDDLLFVPDENKYYLIEYKTMSDFSYRKFESEGLDDSWGYLTQASLYCEALGCEEFILVAQCKSTGHICDHLIKARPELVQLARNKWKRIRENPDEMPERGYEPEPEKKYNRSTKVYDETGRDILGIQCSYCGFKSQCWGDSLSMEVKGDKPIWLVNHPTEMHV